jgi:hypothetical protein
LTGKNPIPNVWSVEVLSLAEAEAESTRDTEKRERLEKVVAHQNMLQEEEIFVGESEYSNNASLHNLFISQCHTCSAITLWLHDRLIYPMEKRGPTPNPDMPADVMRDYEEARAILDLSPRGTAALLRLAVEKICVELKAKGKDINEQIAYLVSKGLPVAVQQSLDAVRVIGNEAVHPGQMDLRDDRETAGKLFNLVNVIVQFMFSNQKQIEELYGMLPDGKKESIEERNTKAKKGAE